MEIMVLKNINGSHSLKDVFSTYIQNYSKY